MNTPRFAFLDWPGPIPFAHQGGASEFPENTMKAFKGAAALGYRYIETDLQTTSDGVLLIFHDDKLDRATDHAGTIAQLPWSVVQQARVHGTEPIPRLEEVLEELPDMRFNLDPKRKESVDSLVQIIKKMGVVDRICVGSFADSRVSAVRDAIGPSLCTGMGRIGISRLRVASWLPLGSVSRALAKTPAACAQIPMKEGPIPVADRRLVDLAHELHLAVQVWTVDEQVDMNRLLDLGVNGIMTNEPSRLKDVLVARGQWFS